MRTPGGILVLSLHKHIREYVSSFPPLYLYGIYIYIFVFATIIEGAIEISSITARTATISI